MSDLTGRALAHYRIESAIGAGGMGQVYRATDTKLGRTVALKVLPPEVASDPHRLARFQREARAVAALNHPNIVTLYSVEESDGVHFLTMELVEGQTLDRLIPAGGLPVERIIEIGGALAEALAAAHEKGIVHRDLKPANVMVTGDGRTKVLDFGLAKDVRAETANDATLTFAGHTQPGIIMGTPAYMSPEQVSGRPLDHRSDIFSLGVVLHQTATGTRPFEGTSAAELVSAILRDTPPPVTDLRPDLPGDLARVIRRCIEKDPRQRVQTARDVANEFRDLARPPFQRLSPSTLPSSRAVPPADSGRVQGQAFWIAVLPLTHAGADPELEAFAEGLAEDITAGLAKFPYLSVISRNSALRFKGQASDVRAVGEQLGARYVLEGALRKSTSNIRVNMQLIDAHSGTHLWSETYNRELKRSDIFAVQDDLTDRVVATVADAHGVLVRSMADSAEDKPESEMTASDWVVRHFSYLQSPAPKRHLSVRDGLERYVEREPRNAAAWACLAKMYLDEFCFGFNTRPDALDRGLTAARRSLDLDRTFQYGNQVMAQAHFFRRDIPAFRNAAEHAVALNARGTNTIAQMGLMFAHIREFDHGVSLARRAMDLNPHHPGWYHVAIIWDYFQKGDYQKALEEVTRANVSGLFWQPLFVACACGLLGRREDAAAAVQELRRLDSDIELHLRHHIECFHYASGLMDRILEGLGNAGLKVPPPASNAAAPTVLVPSTPASSIAATASGRQQALEGVSTPGAASASKHQRRWGAVALVVSLIVIAAIGTGVYLKGSRRGGIDSIAVLPLENRSNDPDADYISDGITESINNSLARLPNLTVVPHSVAFHYKGKGMDVRKAGDELHVQTVLAGRVAQRGDNLTVEVELDDVRNGKQIWGEQYSRKLADLLAVESDIAREVSQRLRSQLSAEDQKNLTKGSTNNPEAYRLYLKGKYYTDKLTKEGFDTGIDYFNQAIAVDPNYGLAYSGLAYNYINQIDWFMPPSEAGPKTKDAAEKALAIDGSDARAHMTLAIEAHWYEWKFATAESEFQRAIELSPNNSEAHLFYAWFLSPMGRNDEALAEARRAQQADPLFPFASFNMGAALLFARQWDPAIEQLRRAIELDPNFWFSHCFLGRAYEQEGRLPEAIAEFQRALEVEKDNTEIWSGLGHAYAVSGKKAEAQKVLEHLKELSAHSWVAPYNVAVIYAGLGEKDQAFALLERAYKDRSYYMATYLATDERLDNLRSDQRLAALRSRVGLSQ